MYSRYPCRPPCSFQRLADFRIRFTQIHTISNAVRLIRRITDRDRAHSACASQSPLARQLSRLEYISGPCG